MRIRKFCTYDDSDAPKLGLDWYSNTDRKHHPAVRPIIKSGVDFEVCRVFNFMVYFFGKTATLTIELYKTGEIIPGVKETLDYENMSVFDAFCCDLDDVCL